MGIFTVLKIFTPNPFQSCLFTPETRSSALTQMYNKAESSSAGHGHAGHENIQVIWPIRQRQRQIQRQSHRQRLRQPWCKCAKAGSSSAGDGHAGHESINVISPTRLKQTKKDKDKGRQRQKQRQRQRQCCTNVKQGWELFRWSWPCWWWEHTGD